MRLHSGVDFVAKEGVPVVAAEDGVVVKALLARNWGNIIVVQHDGTYSTSYSHLKSMDVKEGDKVRKGQVIVANGFKAFRTELPILELASDHLCPDP